MDRKAMDRKAMEREAMEFTEQGAMEVKMVTMVNHGRIAFAAVHLALAERNSMELWFSTYSSYRKMITSFCESSQ